MKVSINVDTLGAVNINFLTDWFINSVGGEEPVWTEAHIEELCNDFIVIPKEANCLSNADKIRNMTDEELAKFLSKKCFSCEYDCCARESGIITDCFSDCEGAILKWLKSVMEGDVYVNE